MADTIVQYILNVDTDRAEKGLRDTSQEAKQTSTQFDRVAASSTGLNSGLKRTERQVVSTTKRFRQMRRAGRDLDGAFSDLGQGLSIVSPAAGNLFMTLSDGASIAEGLGRSLTLFVNPAFVAVAGVTALAAGALFLFQREQKKAEEEAKKLADTLNQSNKIIEDQQKVFDRAQSTLSTYATRLQDAQLDLDVLTGALSQFELAQIRATQAAADFQAGATSENEKIATSLFEQIQAQQKIVDIAKRRRDEAADLAVQDLSFRERQNKNLVNQAKSQNDGFLAATKNLRTQQEILQQLRDKFQETRKATQEIEKEAQILKDTLTKQAEITQEKRDQAKADREAAQARRQFDAETEAIRKRVEDREAAAQKKRNDQASALQELLDLQNNTLLATASESDKIRAKFGALIIEAGKLGDEADNQALAQEIINELLSQQAQELAAINSEEKTRTDLLDRQATLVSSIQSSIGALQSPEAFVGSLGSILEGTGALVGGDTGAGLAAFGASPELALVTALIQSVAGLGSSVQGAIDEAAADGITLNEEQARKVVLGNMNEAFQNFTRDLERGLALLPQIVIDILPEFVVTLAKVISVDLPKFLAFELPIALIRAIPEIVIAVINEIGFLFADLINRFVNALDQFLNFLQTASTREGRQQARSESFSDLGERIAARFDGVTAFLEAFERLDSRVRPNGGAFAGGGAFIPQAQGGMRFTGSARSGLALLHQNEFVVPASGQRPQTVDRQMSSMGGGVNIVINSPVVEQNAVDALVRRIEERFNSNFGLSSSNLFGGR